MHLASARLADRGGAQAIAGLLDLVGWCAGEELTLARLAPTLVQPVEVHRIERALEALQPVAIDCHAPPSPAFGRHRHKRQRRQRRRLALTEKGPDQPAAFGNAIACRPDPRGEVRGPLALAWHLLDRPVPANLPAVIDAAQRTALHPRQRQGGAPVRTAFVDQAERTLLAAERDHVGAE